MKTLALLFFFLAISLNSFSQGWEHVGPDSMNWQDVNRMSIRFLSLDSFYISVATWKGISVYSSWNHSWNYSLRNIPESPFHQGIDYTMLEFSPVETDSAFLGYLIWDTEPFPHLIKISLPTLSSSNNRISGNCWFTQMNIVFPPRSDSLVFAYVCGFQKSTNQGNTWEMISPEPPDYFSNLISTDRNNKNILLSAKTNSLLRSVNQGTTWDSLFTIVNNSYYSQMRAFSQGDTLLVSKWANLFDSAAEKGIFRTTSGGSEWTNVLTGKNVAGFDSPKNENTIFALTDSGVYQSYDFGLTWIVFNNGLPTSNVTNIKSNPTGDTVFIGTNGYGVLKVWRYIVDVKEEIKKPQQFSLSQNYPNPFNAATVIGYKLQVTSFVSIKIYDIKGNEIVSLVNKQMETGEHRVEWNAENVPSGMYFYRLTANNFSETKKLLLLK